MKRTIILLALGILILAALAACNTPQPLPVAPTPIPTLIPATMPEAGLGGQAGRSRRRLPVGAAFASCR